MRGITSPITGVAMTHSMAMAYKATLDEAVAKLEEEKRYCQQRLTIERSAGAEKLEIEKEAAKNREALVQQTLEAERKNSQSLAAEIEKERAAQWLWGAGGVAVGLVTSLALVGGIAVYATVSSALP
jgi:23S rRNA pseudoU1915 N3-methylase RlmH